MQVNIKAVVDDLKNIQVKNVIYEAVMNAIEANATKIDIKIYTRNLDKENQKPYIDKMQIIDNGEGFTQKNIQSFEEYRSAHKQNLGCKGIGRFIYLKIFNHINIKSQNAEIDFTCKGVNTRNIDSRHDLTTIYFLNPIQNPHINFDTIALNIKEHFLAYFKLQTKEIYINIYENDNFKEMIKSTDIPNFETKDFKVKNYQFTISYLFGNDKFKNEGFYAANKRVVVKNSEQEQDRKYDLPKDKDIKIFYVLESTYFDKNVNDERNELRIYPKQKNAMQFEDLNWEEIYNELENQLSIIYKEHNFDIDKTIHANRRKSAIDVPYLSAYFADRNELNIKDMQDKAQQEFNEDKEFLRQKNNKSSKTYEIKLNKVTQAELAEYIFDRDKIIQKLRQSIEKGDIEEKIHNLFMTKRTSDEVQDYKTNNIWLFDDRFMSYDKIFSDTQIKDIFPQLHKNIERPDILSIVSNTYEKEKITDILLIEFKRPEPNKEHLSKEHFSKANQQLLDYASYINESFPQIQLRIWAYGFLEIDDNIQRTIRNHDFNEIYTSAKFPIFYKYNKRNNVIINFMDYNALICDAENRNKLFLDILRGKYINNTKDQITNEPKIPSRN